MYNDGKEVKRRSARKQLLALYTMYPAKQDQNHTDKLLNHEEVSGYNIYISRDTNVGLTVKSWDGLIITF